MPPVRLCSHVTPRLPPAALIMLPLTAGTAASCGVRDTSPRGGVLSQILSPDTMLFAGAAAMLMPGGAMGEALLSWGDRPWQRCPVP